jgi:hypothetical protein
LWWYSCHPSSRHDNQHSKNHNQRNSGRQPQKVEHHPKLASSSYVNGTVVKLAGLQRWSVELQERSDPSFAQIMLDNMTRSYRKATEVATIAAITAGGTQATATAATAPVSSRSFQQNQQLHIWQLATLLAHTPLASANGHSCRTQLTAVTVQSSTAGQPQNSAGSAEQQRFSAMFSVFRCTSLQTWFQPSIDESAFLIVPSAIEIFESSQLMLSVNVPVIRRNRSNDLRLLLPNRHDCWRPSPFQPHLIPELERLQDHGCLQPRISYATRQLCHLADFC